MPNFKEMTRLQQVAHLTTYKLSSQCVAYLLDIPHAQVRPHFKALGLEATKKEGGDLLGSGKAQIIRALDSLGVAESVIRFLADCRPYYFDTVLSRNAA